MAYFQAKNPNLGIFESLGIENVGIYFVVILNMCFTTIFYVLWSLWYILWSFGKFFPVLVCCAKKNLATLISTQRFLKLLKVENVCRILRQMLLTFSTY
jgi:hypothetical protein